MVPETFVRYGWKRDLPDFRDQVYAPLLGAHAPVVDLRPHDTAIYDQGQLGSCTANAIAAHLDFNRKKQGEHPVHPSRLFIYYNERKAEGTIGSDSGASIRDSAKEVKKHGAPKETHWPYDIAKFAETPSGPAYAEAVKYEDLSYIRVPQSLESLRSRLSQGYPVVVGFSVYESFESPGVAQTGIVPMPDPSESLLGGHAVLVLGYDDTKERFIVRNSWGASWGDKGYFYLPYDYLTNPQLASDFWSLEQVK